MVIDTSAITAILRAEPERDELLQAIVDAPKRLMAAFTAVECAVVIERRKGEVGRRELELFLHDAGIDVVAMDTDQAELAKDAYRRYGKGRHPAALNLGDCCAYALAVSTGEALLFKGEPFARTDVKRAR